MLPFHINDKKIKLDELQNENEMNDSECQTEFYSAVINRDYSKMKDLLENEKIDVNKPYDLTSLPPIIPFLEYADDDDKSIKIVKLLIKENLDLKVESQKGENLEDICKRRNLEKIRVLLSNAEKKKRKILDDDE